jgi:hypothetical protein
MPQGKIKEKLRDIGRQRQRLTERLDETTEDLSEAARLVELCLTLLENPQRLYQHCDDEQRRLLNQALSEHIFIEDEDVTDYGLRKPFATLRSVEERHQRTNSDKPDPGATAVLPTDDMRGGYYNPKDQFRALEQLRRKLPSLDTPEPTPTKRDRPQRARQLGNDQIEQLIAGYQPGSTVRTG